MTEQESMDHPSGLPETEGSGEECGNAGSVETLDSCLKLAAECMKRVQNMPSRKFNNEQCDYLAHKLEVVVYSASSFLEVSRTKRHASCSSMDMTRGVEVFRLLLALSKQIESFVQGCCKDEWIQAAMTLTNVSEYVSSLGFNLEICRVAFCKECAGTGSITLDQGQVDDIYRIEVEIVEKKASTDVDTIYEKVISELPFLNSEKMHLASYLLQRLKRIKSIPASVISGSSLGSVSDDGGFFGTLFKRIQHILRLGSCPSGASSVDKAMWLGTLVAMKTFYRPDDPGFRKEVEILGRLCHPNITSMFCSAMDRRRCSIVMELMDEDLHALMQRRLDANGDSPPFTILEAADIMLQIGEGVNYLHNQRIVHRDLKSMNILVKSVKVGKAETGYICAKVADFGLSKIKETSTRFSNQTLNTGTNKWMAPEIINLVTGSQESSSKSTKTPKYPYKIDVYSFAMVCYEILTGSVPFSNINYPNTVKRMVLDGERPVLPGHCPRQLKALIKRCWDKDPSKRPSFFTICSELRYLKCVLMTVFNEGPHLTIEEPLQEATNNIPVDTEHKPLPLSIVDTVNIKRRKREDVNVITLERKHNVFLSHSGAQKGFVEQLSFDLESLDIHPFFDKRQASLPIGEDFPNLVFDAIRHCKVGVLVISEEFFYRSKWPMLELVAMVKETRKLNSSLRIIPVFYGMSPGMFLDPLNRSRWIVQWRKWSKFDKRISLEEWEMALKALTRINGMNLHDKGDVYSRNEIVKAIQTSISLDSQRIDSNVQGRLRLYEVLRKKIYQQDRDGVRVIGLYGMEGIGKTTICKVMCNELYEEFLGKVCHAELQSASKVDVLREVLRRLTNISDKLLSETNIHQYYDRLQRHIHRHRVFLVIDNVSDNLKTIEEAKTYLKAEYAPSSVVLVATRSLGVLQSLDIDKWNCFEMPKLEEAEARALFLYHAAPEYEVHEELLRRCMENVKRFYFCMDDSNSYHYHPLALKEFGLQLGYQMEPEQWTEQLDKLDTPMHPSFLRKSFDMLIPDSRCSFLRKSFDTLILEDQLLFMDAALFHLEPREHASTSNLWNIFKWLSLVHGISVDVVMMRLEDLKSKFLLEHLGDGSTNIGMHPLSREFCESEANVGEFGSRRWVYNDPEIFEEHVVPECGGWKNMRSICLRGGGSRKKLSLKWCTNVTVLKLVRCHVEHHVLDLSPLTNLKSLEVISCTSSMSQRSPVEVLGLGLLTNLLVLKWDKIPPESPCIEEIGLLTKLQVLELDCCDNKNRLPDVGMLCLLREARFRFGDGAYTISGLSSKMTRLRFLDLGGCHSLLNCPGVGDLVALEELDLNDCLELEELPNLQRLRNLKKLDMTGCRSIRALPGLGDLVALQELDLCDCTMLQVLPFPGKLRHLRKLDMAGCLSIKALLGLGDLLALEELDLHGCTMLQQLHSLGKLRHLRKLDITDCCLIEAVPGLGDLISLQELRAERCSELIELPDIRKLRNLLVLNINFEK